MNLSFLQASSGSFNVINFWEIKQNKNKTKQSIAKDTPMH